MNYIRIAATAVNHDLALVTRNYKEFDGIQDLSFTACLIQGFLYPGTGFVWFWPTGMSLIVDMFMKICYFYGLPKEQSG